ncbi:MAG TPA: FtsX-like permease family protein [Acidimicrobiales bacterium]|nr:FtsX-like permease family protein [Acidimicrobiales bacterium]
MLHATVRSLLGRKLRLLSTSVAVVLGVAFLAGTLVLTDTIGRTFDDLFATVNRGTDAYVRGETAFDADEFGDQRPLVDGALLATVGSVPGVQAADGVVRGYTQLVDREGEALGDPNQGAPTFGGNWTGVEALNPFTLVAGRPPRADGEVVIDKGSADEAGYRVGDRATVLTTGAPQAVTVVGIARFGTADSAGGTSYVMFHTAEAQRLVGRPGRFTAIAVVAEDGVTQRELADRIDRALPGGIEVLTGAEITEENQSDIKEQLSFFNIFLLIFAVVALFVGSFIIYNSFSIIVAQRAREMALLRAVGASRRQVTGSVLAEAVAIGLLASLVGLAAGVAVAGGLKALLAGFGIDIPAGGIVLAPRTVAVSLVAGLGVSVVAALVPARKASRVPPVAALRNVAVDDTGRSRRRAVAGGVVVAAGAAFLFGGLFGGGSNAAGSVGFGAFLVFLGVAVLGPLIARPVSRLLGAPFPRLAGMTGTLARQNAMRNPKRTSATAAALMIGVGLVGFITIFAASAKESLRAAVDGSLAADLVVDSGSFGFGGLSPALAGELDALPEVAAASGVRLGLAAVDGDAVSLRAVDPGAFARVVDVELVAGRLDDLGLDGIAVHEDEAEREGLAVGDTVPVRFAETGDTRLRVAAVYAEDGVAGTHLVSLALHEANFPHRFDVSVLMDLADGADPDRARAAVESVAGRYANAEVRDQRQYADAQAGRVDQILNLIYVLLALAVFIALLGIANTLALSILERTRELGLLRAVGMTRRQVRSAVRYESVVIALLGTVLGLAIGLFFGWAMVTALSDEGMVLDLPAGQLAVITVVGAAAGVLAAVLPARRAARLDVLRAIATA